MSRFSLDRVRLLKSYFAYLSVEEVGDNLSQTRAFECPPGATACSVAPTLMAGCAVIGYSDGTIRLIDGLDGSEILISNNDSPQRVAIAAIATASDNSKISTASGDGKVHVFETVGFVSIGIFQCPIAPAICVAFNYENSAVVAGFGDRAIRIWDIASGLLMQILQPLQMNNPVHHLCFNHSGTHLIATCRYTTLVWLAVDFTMIGSLSDTHSFNMKISGEPKPTKPIKSKSKSASEAPVVALSVRIAQTKKRLNSLGNRWVSALCSSSRGLLAIGYRDGSISLWDDAALSTASGCIMTFAAADTNIMSCCINSMVFHPDGVLLLVNSYGDEDSVNIWNALTGTIVFQNKAPEIANAVVFL